MVSQLSKLPRQADRRIAESSRPLSSPFYIAPDFRWLRWNLANFFFFSIADNNKTLYNTLNGERVGRGGGGGGRLTVCHGKCLAVDLRLNDYEVKWEGGSKYTPDKMPRLIITQYDYGACTIFVHVWAASNWRLAGSPAPAVQFTARYFLRWPSFSARSGEANIRERRLIDR